MDPRVAVVTGGGTGIGRAVAATCAKQGDKVVILGRRAEVLQRTAEELGVRGIDQGAPLEEAERVWDEVVGANLKGAFLMAWAALPHLRRPGGRIVNVSSVAAFTGRGGAYTAAKAGVAGLTYWLALDLGPQGITVNAVAPGFIEDTEFFGGGLTAEGRRSRVSQIPACRPGRPEEVAAAIAWLAAPEAAYVNGEVHHVNGGWLFGR